MKVTERVLKEYCQKANQDLLKKAPFGVLVEKGRGGYLLVRCARRPGEREIISEDLPPKELLCFIQGFLKGYEISTGIMAPQLEKFREALAKTGCNALICEEFKRNCDACPAGCK